MDKLEQAKQEIIKVAEECGLTPEEINAVLIEAANNFPSGRIDVGEASKAIERVVSLLQQEEDKLSKNPPQYLSDNPYLCKE